MEHPLKWQHWIGRELVCFFLGHNWKHAKRYHTQYYGKSREEVPYEYRARGRGRGNYMWDSHSWWSVKCTRCRTKTEEFAWHPWYNCLWRGIQAGITHTGWVLFDEDNTIPKWKLWVAAIPLFIVGILIQVFLQFDKLPSFLWTIPADIQHKIYCWFEPE